MKDHIVQNKTRVFFIIRSYSMGGGAEALLTTIVNNLPTDKYEIGIFELIHYDVKVEPTNPGIKIYPYYLRGDDPERGPKMYPMFHEWDRMIKEYIPDDYDLYVSFNYQRPSFLLPPGRKNIAWIHGAVYDLAEPEMAEERELQREAFKKATRVVGISDKTTDSILELFPEVEEKYDLIYNGIDIEKIRARAKEPCYIEIKNPGIAVVGRLDDNKDPLRALEIFKLVAEKRPDVHIYYIGKGDLDKPVLEKASEYDLQERVHLLGFLENPFSVVSKLDMTLMSSKSEGFPLALLESVALSKPFVSTYVGGAKILANNGKCGKVIETDEEAAEGILEILDEKLGVYKDNCDKHIKNFSLNNYIKSIELLFTEVLGE